MAHIRWAKGGEANVTAAKDDLLELASTISSAPGSRLDGSIEGGAAVRVKVHRCVRTEAGFTIEGRLLDARKDLRAALAKAAAGTSEPEPGSS